MRDNLIFEGLAETESKNCEEGWRLPGSEMKSDERQPRKCYLNAPTGWGLEERQNWPIVAKMSTFKDKEIILRKKKTLAGTNFGVNDQYPPEILERRKVIASDEKGKIRRKESRDLSRQTIH